MMERIRALIADAQQYVAAASPRERRMLGLAAAGIVAFVLFVTWITFSRAISRADTALQERRLDFDKVKGLAANYGAQEQERQLLEARLRQSPPALMGFVDERAKAEGIEVGGMSDRGVTGGTAGKPRESSVEVNLGKVPLDKLMRLLQAIESSPGVVKVRRLRLRKNPDNKETLDVSLTVTAWQGA
jgi:type II secretory pathway component PulM